MAWLLVGGAIFLLLVMTTFAQKSSVDNLLIEADEKLAAGEQEVALEYWADILKRVPDDPRLWYKRGRIKASLGRHDGAIADFDKSLELNPNDAEAWHHRGLAHYEQGNVDRSIGDLEQALILNPGYAHTDYRNIQRPDNQEPLGDVDPNDLTYPELIAALMDRANARVEAGDLDMAVSDFGRMLDITPNHQEARRMREEVRQRSRHQT